MNVENYLKMIVAVSLELLGYLKYNRRRKNEVVNLIVL